MILSYQCAVARREKLLKIQPVCKAMSTVGFEPVQNYIYITLRIIYSLPLICG